MADRLPQRVLRLLGLLAYVAAAGPTAIETLAERFGTTPARIRADVAMLGLTGTPGYWPDDLIDFDFYAFDEGVVQVTNPRGLDQPLRFTRVEAAALIAALRAVFAAFGPTGAVAAAAASASAKLTAAAASADAEFDPGAVDVSVDMGAEAPTVLSAVTQALVAGRQLRLDYVTAADEVTTRAVDPVELVVREPAGYLVAWCRRSSGPRTFRLDRMLRAVMLPEAVDSERVARLRDEVDIATSITEAAAVADLVTIRFRAQGRYLAEQVPSVAVRECPGGEFELDLPIAEPAWLRRLLLSSARHIVAVTPPQALADAAGDARRALARY